MNHVLRNAFVEKISRRALSAWTNETAMNVIHWRENHYTAVEEGIITYVTSVEFIIYMYLALWLCWRSVELGVRLLKFLLKKYCDKQ